MTQATDSFGEMLPVRIDRAEIEGPTLLIGGTEWSMSATCEWRWVKPDGSLVTPATSDTSDRVWDLVGEHIIEAQWSDTATLGLDPRFILRSGGALEIISDATFDTWVLHTPARVLVGPLPRD